MKLLKYSEILASNRELAKTIVGQPYRIVLLSNIVINQLGEILEFVLRGRGINAQVSYGGYDNIVQDSICSKHADAVIVFWEAANFIDGFSANAEVMEPSDLAALAERVENELALVLNNLREVPLVLINKFSGLLYAQDSLRESALEKLAKRLNAALEKCVSPHHVAVDTIKILASVGLSGAVDFRQYQSTKALYTIAYFKSYVEYIAPAFYAVRGLARKLLVLDCDNTLWGGTLGEDGDSKIQMNSSTRLGCVFHEVQQILLGLRKQGVLLALCSKNNFADVDHVLTAHVDMLLRNESWVAKKINWQDKATNLREIAAELNIGLDSIVFIDDSSFEIGLVQEELPEVVCVKVPETISDYPAAIRKVAQEFFRLSLTSEDMLKTEMYQQEQSRGMEKLKFSSLDDYLQSLDLMVRVTWNDRVSITRAAQLTQKTNQFNLTTRRYTEADIARMLTDDGFAIATFSVSDRYGDYGTTGLTILQMDEGVARMETLLMSCRVIGRNVERAFFDNLVNKLRAMGVTKLEAEYLQTPKNEQVSGFYDSLGFHAIEVQTNLRKYDLMLADYRHSGIDYIEVEDDVS